MVASSTSASKFKNDYVVKADKLHFSLVSLWYDTSTTASSFRWLMHSPFGVHCSTSWIVFDRVTVAAGRMVFAGIIFLIFIFSHIQNVPCRRFSAAFFFFHSISTSCYVWNIESHCMSTGGKYTICLTASTRGLANRVELYRAATRWPMPCFAKAKKRKKLLPRETKRQRAHTATNDWWFNKSMAFFIQLWLFFASAK